MDSEAAKKKQNIGVEVPHCSFESAEDYVKSCVVLQAESMLPFLYWDAELGRILHQPFDDHFRVSTRCSAMRARITAYARKIRSQVRAMVQGQLINLVLGIGFSDRDGFLSVGLQLMTQLRTRVVHLGFVYPQPRHTTEDIEGQIAKILQRFKITMDQLHTITTDNGKHVIYVVDPMETFTDDEAIDREDAEEENKMALKIEQELFKGEPAILRPMRNPVHTIQLAANVVLAEYAARVEGIKPACFAIRKEMIAADSEVPVPPQPRGSAWASTYNMLSGLLQEDVREKYQHSMTDEDWKLAQEITEALKPLHTLVTRAKKEQHIFGDLVTDIVVYQRQLKNMESGFAARFGEELKARKEEILNKDNMPLQAALFLDPRFNCSGSKFFSSEQRQRIIGYLLELNQRIECVKQRAPPKVLSLQEEETEWLRKGMGHDQDDGKSINELLQAVGSEGFDSNVQQFWENSNYHRPQLAVLVDMVLGTPSSQVSVERAFSSLQIIFDKEADLRFVKMNIEFIK